MSLRLTRKHDQALVVSHGKVADQFLTRLLGLIGKKSFNDGEALLFPRCNSVHMWMMSMPIDVLFLKAAREKQGEWEIVKTFPNARPWRLLPVGCMSADDTLELPSGTISKFNLKTGEVLCFA